MESPILYECNFFPSDPISSITPSSNHQHHHPHNIHPSKSMSTMNGSNNNNHNNKLRDFSPPIRSLDLADLNSPEISFDLQQFISSEIASAQVNAALVAASGTNNPTSGPGSSTPTSGSGSNLNHNNMNGQIGMSLLPEDSVNLFTELLEAKSSGQMNGHRLTNGSMGHGGPNGLNNSNGYPYAYDRSISVKREPSDHTGSDKDLFTSSSSGSSTGSSYPNFGHDFHPLSSQLSTPMRSHHVGSGSASSSSSSSSSKGGMGHKMSKKNADKGTDEYKKRRERNNIAVRKSREKAKLRSRETEKRVSELQRDNEGLRKQVDRLANQLGVLKNLLTSAGFASESIDNEISRNLMEGHL